MSEIFGNQVFTVTTFVKNRRKIRITGCLVIGGFVEDDNMANDNEKKNNKRNKKQQFKPSNQIYSNFNSSRNKRYAAFYKVKIDSFGFAEHIT